LPINRDPLNHIQLDFWDPFSALKIPNIAKGGRWDLFEKAANASLIA
jgi:hypothetical protein